VGDPAWTSSGRDQCRGFPVFQCREGAYPKVPSRPIFIPGPGGTVEIVGTLQGDVPTGGLAPCIGTQITQPRPPQKKQEPCGLHIAKYPADPPLRGQSPDGVWPWLFFFASWPVVRIMLALFPGIPIPSKSGLQTVPAYLVSAAQRQTKEVLWWGGIEAGASRALASTEGGARWPALQARRYRRQSRAQAPTAHRRNLSALCLRVSSVQSLGREKVAWPAFSHCRAQGHRAIDKEAALQRALIPDA